MSHIVAVGRWVAVLEAAASRSVDDLAAALGLRWSTVERLGRQRNFVPPVAGTTRCEFVVDARDAVQHIALDPAGRLTAADLAAVLGTGERAPRGPHDTADTVLFPETGRGWRVHVRLRTGSDAVDTVYLRPPRPSGAAGDRAVHRLERT